MRKHQRLASRIDDLFPQTVRVESCEGCGGLFNVSLGCRWCASGGHLRAEAARFRNRWEIAQFPERARLMPRACYE